MQARLIFEDGEILTGTSFGYTGNTTGEVVFTTGMVGYPETLTDPSFAKQILVCTYPLIGNYGIPNFEAHDEHGLKTHFESDSIHLSALIVSEYSENYNHHDANMSLSTFLREQKIPGISGIDTRYLTQKIRDGGCKLAKIEVGDTINTSDFHDPNQELLAYSVAPKEKKIYGNGKKRICLVDMGVKNNILRNLLQSDTTIIRVPGHYPFMDDNEVYDGIFLSNGPGNPELYTSTIKQVKKALEKNIPIFGICLGNQLLAIASGATTYKLPFGHRGQNQPCKDLQTGKCIVTSQNHSFAIDESTLPKHIQPWFQNINDNTNEGIYFIDRNARSVQFHPESSPGPDDARYLFENFISSL